MDRIRPLLKRYLIPGIVLVLLLIVTVLYVLGFRIGGAGIVQVGTLVVRDIPDGTSVYFDESRVQISANGTVETSLLPGTHSVIVDVPGMQPWNELFDVVSGETTNLYPILVPKEPEPVLLVGESNTNARALLTTYKLPTKEAPITLADGCISVYVSGPRILATATSTPSCVTPAYLACPADALDVNGECSPTLVFASSAPIHSVVAFPERDDALVVAAGTLSYVIELDPRKPQFFSPIARGVNLRVAPWSASAILLTKDANIYELPL